MARRIIRTRAQLLEAPILKAKADREAAEVAARKAAALEKIRQMDRDARDYAKRKAEELKSKAEEAAKPSAEAMRVSNETGISPYEAEQLITLARGTVARDNSRQSRRALNSSVQGLAAAFADLGRAAGGLAGPTGLTTPNTAPGAFSYEMLSITSTATKAEIELQRSDGAQVKLNMLLADYEKLCRMGTFDPNMIFAQLDMPFIQQGDILTVECGKISFE